MGQEIKRGCLFVPDSHPEELCTPQRGHKDGQFNGSQGPPSSPPAPPLQYWQLCGALQFLPVCSEL